MKLTSAKQILSVAVLFMSCYCPFVIAKEVNSTIALTPKAKPEPRINGPKVTCVRPGHPILFTISTSGNRPMAFSASQLPKGVKVDSQTGQISGSIIKAGNYAIKIEGSNSLGKVNLS